MQITKNRHANCIEILYAGTPMQIWASRWLLRLRRFLTALYFEIMKVDTNFKMDGKMKIFFPFKRTYFTFIL